MLTTVFQAAQLDHTLSHTRMEELLAELALKNLG